MINMYNIDCIEFMRDKQDNYYDLSICDPQYGINYDGQRFSTSSHGGRRSKKFKGWDDKPPGKNYFNELFRVSKNQIIWGANYFTKFIPASMGWIFWDKGQRIAQSDGELAFSSFKKALRVYLCNRVHLLENGDTNHPTQKPVRLYKWLLKNYAKEGDKIFDSHGGSGSICIACHDMKFDLDWCELDKDYFESAKKRFENHKKQLTLF